MTIHSFGDRGTFAVEVGPFESAVSALAEDVSLAEGHHGPMSDLPELEGLARAFGEAVATKDHARIRALLHPDLDYRAMTPGRVWEGDGADDVVAALRMWFDDSDVVEGVDALEAEAFADRGRVGYRLRVRNADGLHLVEQQAYVGATDGRIGWLRIMCAGYRPVPA